MAGDRALVVDLTSRTSRVQELSPEVMDRYVGGRGLGVHLLWDYTQPDLDPLGPDNPIILCGGPAQGSKAFYSPKCLLATKSPLTGIYLYTIASGWFGYKIRAAGYMALIVTGKADYPTYLVVSDGQVEFRDARPLWGQKSNAAQRLMLEQSGLKDAAAVTIGPAGERGLMISAVVTEGDGMRTFGRGGAGAVLGSKNLKGVVADGSRTWDAVDKTAYQEWRKFVLQELKTHNDWAESQKKYGSGSDMLVLNEFGILPTRNWQSGQFEEVEAIAPTTAIKEWPRKMVPCGPYCPTPCSHVADIDRGPYKGAKTEGPEYETLYIFGSNCGVGKFDAIVAAEQICDEYGVDTMSAGMSVGFAMECYERGLLSQKDADSLDLRFGNDQAMIALLRKMMEQEGVGRLFCHGVKRASEQIPGSDSFAMHSKGMEFGGYEPRGAVGQGLQYALSNRGGCHHDLGLPARTELSRGTLTQVEGKGQILKDGAMDRILYDMAILCTFPRRAIGGKATMQHLFKGLLGRDYSVAETEDMAMRVLTLERLFNVREGVRREDDRLPERLLKEPSPAGPNRGTVVPLEALKDDAYKVLGWDLATGIPTQGTIARLGLADRAAFLSA